MYGKKIYYKIKVLLYNQIVNEVWQVVVSLSKNMAGHCIIFYFVSQFKYIAGHLLYN